MIRPDNIPIYEACDLKLGIKSSLPNVKSTIALTILFWECSGRPSELIYSTQNGDGIVVTNDLYKKITDYLNNLYGLNYIDYEKLESIINENQLFKSQLEALIVAFELIWKIAKVDFAEGNKPLSSERTGGIRYEKKLIYTINMDTISCLMDMNLKEFVKVLLCWIKYDIKSELKFEKQLIKLVSIMSECSIFKLCDGDEDVIFNQNSIYRKILESNQEVDINGDKEAKGPLRILKSLLSERLNPFLTCSNGRVNVIINEKNELDLYQKRVETYLQLSSTKVINADEIENNITSTSNLVGYNKIYYGIPGCGKSYYIENTVLKDVDKDKDVFRTTFYLDYSNSDFIGQIYPVVENGNVTYKPKPGPFTKALERALRNHGKMTYLVIEEINRGNAAAIFGDTFQLLDRLKENRDDRVIGDSEYPVANEFIEGYFEEVNKDLKDEDEKIKFTKNKIIIPHNLTLLATMNTSDQNVFPLDTAFKRRWDREKVMTDWNEVDDIKNLYIPYTDVTWEKFAKTINDKMLEDNEESDVSVSEDKQMGAYFVKENMLSQEKNIGDKDSLRAFISNVMDYLYNDVTKFNHGLLFDNSVKTYDGLYETMTECTSILNGNVDNPTVGAGKRLFDQEVEDEQGTQD